MTTRELQDWHIRRVDAAERIASPWSCGDERFPATIDGAASAMPPGWTWTRYETDSGGETWAAGPTLAAYTVKALGTGNEIHDRYLLAKLAWEAMGPTK